MKSKKNLSVVITVILCCFFSVSCTNEQQKIESIAKNLNKHCPIEVSGGAGTVVSVEVLPEKTLKMNLYINTGIEIGLDDSMKDAITESMKIVYVSMAKNDKDLKALKDMGGTLIISIVTSNNETFEIAITPEDFENAENVKLTSGGMDSAGNIRTILETLTANYRKHLPEVDKETGVKTIDCYVEGMTMVTVCELPNAFWEGEDIDAEVFSMALKPIMVEMIMSDPSMKYVIDKGVIVKYVYKKENGSVFAEQKVNKADLYSFDDFEY